MIETYRTLIYIHINKILVSFHKAIYMTILQILRSLHPEKDLHTDEEMLDSSLSQWRREAELALHIKEVNLFQCELL